MQQRIREGRVELCNAFFLEPTINLSGGEALVKMGVEGLRWQQQVMGVRPRLSWMIDVTGMHEQMAQIVTGLGLDALVYCRLNPTGSTMHWLESPDGTRTLAISPGHYLEWRPMFGAKEPLAEKQLLALADDIRARIEPPSPDQDAKRPDAADLKSLPRRTPTGAPVLILGGSGDYNLAPLCKSYPSEFLQQFRKVAPEFDVKFTTPSRYLDAVLPGIHSGAIQLPVLRGGTEFTYNAFWIQNPRVKIVVSPLRTVVAGGRDAGHRGQPARQVRVSGAGSLSRLAVDVPEHGPQHALGRGRRHGVRARAQLGRSRSLRVGRAHLPRHRRAHPACVLGPGSSHCPFQRAELAAS